MTTAQAYRALRAAERHRDRGAAALARAELSRLASPPEPQTEGTPTPEREVRSPGSRPKATRKG